MSELSFQIPNTLSNPTQLPADMQRSLTQLKQQNNRAPGIVRQPVPGGKVPRGRKRGDTGTRPTARGIAVRVYADKESSREVEIPEDASNYMGLQSGTAAPTTDNFAEDQYGWFYDSAASTMYFVINNGGTITNISTGTLTGVITADQHGPLGRVDSATNPLHTSATTAQAGFLAATDKALLATASSTASNSSLVLRDASGDIAANRFEATTSYRVAGSKVVDARKTGWDALSGFVGTPRRSTFNTSTVTLDTLAREVLGIIYDLSATSGHGLIDA